MSKLQDLIKSLKAYSILIIEDEITYIDDPVKLLIRFCKADNWVKEAIIEDLNTINFNTLSEAIEDFNTEFTPLLSNKEEVENFLTGGYLERFLKKFEKEELLENKVFEEFNAALKKDTETESIKAIFAKYGIYLNINDAHYGQLLSELNGIEGVQILYYKQTPGSNKDSFYADILKSVERTSSNFCLAIIDKSLSTGSANEVGKEFIIDDLVGAYKDNSELRFIACLYTSRPDPDEKELIEYEDFFIEEITKGSDQVIDKMTKSLAQSAFAEVFNSLRKKKIDSSEEAFKLALRNQKNIKYIISESHNEGIPSYDATKYWFDLAKQKKFDDIEVADYKLIAGLSAFFKHGYLDDHPKTSEIGDELLEINTFELFDYNVNKKYMPIAPGDIWEKDGSYFILVGQLCDLLLRKNNTRKAKIAELFKIELAPETPKTKYEIKLVGENKYVYINNFRDKTDGYYKPIRVEISTPNIYYADLSVLDLCMYNEKGECEIDPNEELRDHIKFILPENNDKYYDELRSDYQKLGEVKVMQLYTAMRFNDPIEFSKTKFKKLGDKYIYGLRRVSRLKGRYFDSLYNNYLNNKGRIDLNLIDNSPELIRQVKLTFDLPGDVESTRVLDNFELWAANGNEYFRLSDIQDALSDYKNLLSFCINDRLTSNETNQYILVKESQLEYHLTHKYRFGDNNYVQKQEFSFKDLFGEAKPSEDGNFQILNSNNVHSFFNEAGYATRKLTIEELKLGVKIFDKKVKIQLVNGVLERERYEE